jgi:hypothetical protein
MWIFEAFWLHQNVNILVNCLLAGSYQDVLGIAIAELQAFVG